MKLKLPFNKGKVKFYNQFPGAIYRETRIITKVSPNGTIEKGHISEGIIMCISGLESILEVNYEEKTI